MSQIPSHVKLFAPVLPRCQPCTTTRLCSVEKFLAQVQNT
jgi:hypothetical protein